VISTSSVPDPNSLESIQQRAAEGKLTWVAPFLFLPGRSILLILGQAFFALLYHWRDHPSPWSAAGAWWTVWGTLADAGCHAILYLLTRREDLRIGDLLGTIVPQFFLRGLGYFFVIAPFSVVGSVLASWIVYGSWMAPLPAGLFVASFASLGHAVFADHLAADLGRHRRAYLQRLSCAAHYRSFPTRIGVTCAGWLLVGRTTLLSSICVRLALHFLQVFRLCSWRGGLACTLLAHAEAPVSHGCAMGHGRRCCCDDFVFSLTRGSHYQRSDPATQWNTHLDSL
jgi:hypothetical protein